VMWGGLGGIWQITCVDEGTRRYRDMHVH